MIYKRTDANQKQIIADLEKVGVCVVNLSDTGGGVCDILTHCRGNAVLVEIKHGKTANVRRSQIELMARYTGYIGVARTFEEAENLAKFPSLFALRWGERNKLQQWQILDKDKKVKIGIAKFLKIIGRE